MLTPVIRRALVLLVSTIVILESASAERTNAAPVKGKPCLNNKKYRFNRKANKTCAWIGKNARRKKKLCRKFQVKKNCPETCNFDCNKKVFRCPPSLPRNGSSCARFKEDLTCEYNYKYTGTCDGYETDFGCNALTRAKCIDEKWSVSKKRPNICPPSKIPPGSPLEDLPFGETCNPRECPLLPPLDKSSCSNYDGKDICRYNYGLFGCTDDDKMCIARDMYSCDRKDPKNPVWKYSKFKPKPCILPRDFAPPSMGTESCDPKACPVVEPKKGSRCADYEGNETCHYGYETFGCDANSITCVAKRSYICNRRNNMWMPKRTFRPKCKPSPDLPVGLPCDPDNGVPIPEERECPAKEPQAGRICKYKGKEVCKYDYQIFGCKEDSLKCVSMKHYFCNKNRWFYQEPALPRCRPPPELPVGETCKPGDDITLPPVLDKCPMKKPKANSGCSEYMDGLDCNYDYRWTGCTKNEQSCSPSSLFSCIGDAWRVALVDPLPCADGSSPIGDRCNPNDIVVTLPPVLDKCPLKEPEGNSGCSEYMDGLHCEYGFRWTGCRKNERTCEPSKLFSCFGGVWRVALHGIPNCRYGGSPFGDQCKPGDILDTKPPVLDKCPMKKPEANSGCSEYMDGLDCNYDYRWTGCTKNEQSCSPSSLFSCIGDAWRVALVDPLPCTDGSSSIGDRCNPNDIVVTLPPKQPSQPADGEKAEQPVHLEKPIVDEAPTIKEPAPSC